MVTVKYSVVTHEPIHISLGYQNLQTREFLQRSGIWHFGGQKVRWLLALEAGNTYWLWK